MSTSKPNPPKRPAVRVTVAQLSCSDDRVANRIAAIDAIRIAASVHADLVVLPEYASAFDPRGVGADLAEPLDGPFISGLREVAASAGIAVIAGTAVPSQGRVANVAVAIDGSGDIVGTYQKVHLYDAFGHRESDQLIPGPADAPALVIEIHGLSIGVMTCYDLRFPESARRLVDAGAQVLVIPSAWVSGPLKELHWRTLAIARAIENTCAVVAVGQAGRGVIGRSMVIGPDGAIGLELDEAPAIRTVDLDPDRLAEVRQINPSLANRRYRVVPA